MAVNICLEALLRLFFEILRVLFGNVTLLWKGGYFESELPYLISTCKWIFVFVLIAALVKNHTLRNLLIVGIPATFNLLIDTLNLIPFVGTFFSIGAGIIGVPIAALAWSFALWIDDRVHPLLRIFATPGIMILAAVNAVWPTSIFGDLGYALLSGFLPEISAFIGLIVIGVITILNPTFLCSAINKVLLKWETIRYEGWGAAIFGCFFLIKNKAIEIRHRF